MKTLFTRLWRRNLGFLLLGIQSNLEYRANFFIDAFIQPLVNAGIEVLLWIAVFWSAERAEIAGFARNDYLSYAIWASFFARIASNWMYEFRMVQEIDSGSVNTILARPISFFECYFSQFMGYKIATSFMSFLIPLGISFFLESRTDVTRLPLATLLTLYYLVFLYLISWSVASLAFYFNRVSSFTVAKNLFLWLLSGELFPLDLLPEPLKTWVIFLPFNCGVYTPVGYLTGRVPLEAVLTGFGKVTLGILLMTVVAQTMWRSGLKRYAGTGA